VVITDHDVTGLVIRTHPSVSIRGHVRYDAEDAKAERPQINLFAMIVVSDLPVPGMGSSAPVEADGTFVIHNVFGSSVIRSGYSLQGRTGWYPGPILLNGRDITNVPVEFETQPDATLEVVFTQRYSGLIGRVVDQAGLPSPQGVRGHLFVRPEAVAALVNHDQCRPDGRQRPLLGHRAPRQVPGRGVPRGHVPLDG